MNHGSFKISASSAKILLAIDRVSKFALVKDYIYAKKGHSVFFCCCLPVTISTNWPCFMTK